MMKHSVTSMTTNKVLMGTWLAVSLHWRNVVKDETGIENRYQERERLE
jgi:hypothetical protein